MPLILSSCTKPTAISSEDEDKVLLLNASFVFDIAQNAEGERIATLLFDQCYYSFPNEVMIEETLVAGDQLSIVFNGDYQCFCLCTFPGNCDLEGDVKSYSLLKAPIVEIHLDDGTISDMADSIRRNYFLNNEYVILDEEGRYTSLNDYNGQDLFLSENRRMAAEYCTCPEGAECGPCPFYVAGLYAYNPVLKVPFLKNINCTIFH